MQKFPDKIIEVAAEPAILINYKILVGTFKTKLPESIAKSIKKFSTHKNAENKHIYDLNTKNKNENSSGITN
jgi:hypothetical protein